MAEFKLRHHNATPVGGYGLEPGATVKIVAIETGGSLGYINCRVNNGPQFYWGTADGKRASEYFKVGDLLPIIRFDDIYVYVDFGEEIKISPRRVLEAAKASPEAEKLLKKLFPSAFPMPEVKPDWTRFKDYNTIVAPSGEVLMERRSSGIYEGHFFLSGSFDWKIEKDNDGVRVLVCREKVQNEV